MARWLRMRTDGVLLGCEIEGIKDMYREIGHTCNMVQVVQSPDTGLEIWLDEDGKIKNPIRPNPIASAIGTRIGAIDPDDFLCGDILFGRSGGDEGEPVHLTASDVDWLHNFADTIKSSSVQYAMAAVARTASALGHGLRQDVGAAADLHAEMNQAVSDHEGSA
jgi:hypothetical protein